jgi:erythromycin esterase-like protein
VRFALALLACALLEDSPAPKAVVDWLGAAQKHAPAVSEIVAPKDGAAPRIVIAGRAAYGTVELAQFEGRLAALAKAGDVIALDTGLSEGEALDHWLRTGTGKLAEILDTSGACAWSRAETEAWLTSLSKHAEKPRIVGIATGDPRAACAEFLAWFSKVDAPAFPRVERALQPLALTGRKGEPRYAQLDDNERVILRMGLEETLGLVRDAEEKYAQQSSASEYARNLRLLVALQQYEETMRFEREAGEHDPRGRILAENALSTLKAGTEHTRVFAFVGLRDLARASDGDSFAAQLVALGAPRATCIGTACGTATFHALDPNAMPPRQPRELKLTLENAGAFERALAATGGTSTWILDLRQAPTDTNITAWLAANHSLRSARPVCGAATETTWDHALPADFDAVAWFPALTASANPR